MLCYGTPEQPDQAPYILFGNLIELTILIFANFRTYTIEREETKYILNLIK
jgi:hypothetical protein